MWAAVWVSVLALVFQHTHARGTYSALAPKVLRPNSDYTVVLSAHGTEEILRVTVEVGGDQDAGGQPILNRQIVVLEPESSKTLKFEIGELGSGNYNLTVTGYGAFSFRNTTKLQYEGKSYSVFIQTDRGVYKAGDTIKFRAIVVNPLLKPSVTGAIDVYVNDGAGNRVKQWLRVFTNRGVFSGEIPLSAEPVMGHWNITVEVLGQKTSVSVFVVEYVLPKFEVEVLLPEYSVFTDKHIVATIKAQYTHGRPVIGELTLQVSPTYKYAYLQVPYHKPVSVIKMMKGKTDITLSMLDDLKLKEDYIRELQFTAYVKEELTERVQNATSKITVYRFPYKMQFIRTSNSFKPGLKYSAFLKMSYQDGSPIREGQVTVRHAFSRDQSQFIENVHQIPPNGIVSLEFYPPISDSITNLALEAQYKNLTQWLADLTRAQSPTNAFLQATVKTEEPKVGEEVVISLNATQPMVYFVFEIMGRGDVIFAQTLQAHKGTSHDFRFAATLAMAPRARLIVYYVKDDGEIVADSLHFSIDGALQNQVTVSVNPRTADAGENVAVTVTTKPNAFVGIAAIDQSSLLLSEGNQLTEDGILNELESYDCGEQDMPSPWHFLKRRKKRSLSSWHGTTTAADVFENAGVIILTNGLLHDFNPFIAGLIPVGVGPVDGSKNPWDRRQPAINGAFGRPFVPLGSVTLRPDLYGPGVVYKTQTRPPLAGPYAFSFLPPPPDDKPRIYLNKAMPNYWIFQDAATRLNGIVTLRERAPDTMTSYVLSAFAIDDFYGLGVATTNSKLTVFRPFFVSLHLPSSVIREEAVAVDIVVFNYGKKQITANVTLYNPGPGDFLFPDFINQIDQASPSLSRSKTVTIEPESGTALSFMIVPQKLGTIDIKISAVSSNAVDIVQKQLVVKPEGTQLVVNRPLLIDLRNEKSFTHTVNITTPRNIVEGSLSISVSVIGDILGAAVTDLDKLIELPTGCGEQNMAKMIPNIVLVDYLKNKKQLSAGYLERATKNMELGYQRELTFKHKNGSFSAFGDRDKSGSTWLTAFVIESFVMARRYIDIEDSVITEATNWLMRTQELDGSFKEQGSINNEALQGGVVNSVPLTAYVVIALIKVQKVGLQGIRNPINRALEYLTNQLETLDDPYELAITTYALQLANSPFRDSAFYQLEAKAQLEDDKKWWSGGPLRKTIETTVESRPLDIEMTSYVLLIYTLRGLVQDSLPIVKWLTSQRNQNGGFQSTQDTTIGMQGLSAMAKLMSNSNPLVEVRIISGQRGDTVLVNNNNAMTTQRREIMADTKSVMIKARGSGFAVAQVTYSFNVNVTGPGPSFSLDPQVDINSDSNKLYLTTCTGYSSGNSSNMAVMDVSLPSGYVIDHDLIPSLYKYDRVKRVEKKKDDAGVLIYFDSLTTHEVCPSISAYRVNKVAFQKRSPIVVYDYYDPSRQARQFYSPAKATLCDICDLNECEPSQCERQIVELNRQFQDREEYYPATVEVVDGGGSLVGPRTFALSAVMVLAFILI